VESPFVVLGDDSPEQVKGHASHVVRWAVDRLKRDFFAREPERILDVWLFKDSASYESNAVSLFGERPSTPYGYYSPEHGALVMNIATGGGTLVHEIVHPFMAANFPALPGVVQRGARFAVRAGRRTRGSHRRSAQLAPPRIEARDPPGYGTFFP
jgi:hypothetical protein